MRASKSSVSPLLGSEQLVTACRKRSQPSLIQDVTEVFLKHVVGQRRQRRFPAGCYNQRRIDQVSWPSFSAVKGHIVLAQY